MLIETFIGNIARRLRDVGKKQWDDDFLLSATNAAISALCRAEPQVYTVNRNLTLAEGTEQSIDADLHKIITILHNVKADGSEGRAITKTDLSVLDAAYPQWRQDAPREYIRHWMNDEFAEGRFYVWPPAEAKRDAVVADTTDTPTVTIPDEPVDPGVPEIVSIDKNPWPLTGVRTQGGAPPVSGDGTHFRHDNTSDITQFNSIFRDAPIRSEYFIMASLLPSKVSAATTSWRWYENGSTFVADNLTDDFSADSRLMNYEVESLIGDLVPGDVGIVFRLVERSEDGSTGKIQIVARDIITEFDWYVFEAPDYQVNDVTQDDVDTYNAALADYNKAVALVSGVVIPVERPVLPVDPGELQNAVISGMDPATLASPGSATADLVINNTTLTHTSGGNTYVNVGVPQQALYTSGKRYFEIWIPVTLESSTYGFYSERTAGAPLDIGFIGETGGSFGFSVRNGNRFNSDNTPLNILNPEPGVGVRVYNKIDFDTGLWEVSVNGTDWFTAWDAIPPGYILGMGVRSGGDIQIFLSDDSFENTVPDGYEAYFNGIEAVTQAQIDAYQAALVQYDIDLQAYIDYQVSLSAPEDEPVVASGASPGHTIRGTFSKTPRIDVLEPPTVPDEPVAPVFSTAGIVDPGELGDGGSAAADGGVYLLTAAETGFAILQTQGTQEQIDDLIALNGSATLRDFEGVEREYDLVFDERDDSRFKASGVLQITTELGAFGTTSSGSFLPVSLNGVNVNYDNPLVQPGETIRVRIDNFNGGFEIQADAVHEPGTTQAEIDQYQSDLANAQAEYQAELDAYNALVAERDAAIATLDAFNTRDVLTRSDELPLDDMHVPSLEEFALYYCYAVDDDVTANSGRAQRHWLAFFQLINKAEDSALMITKSQDVTE